MKALAVILLLIRFIHSLDHRKQAYCVCRDTVGSEIQEVLLIRIRLDTDIFPDLELFVSDPDPEKMKEQIYNYYFIYFFALIVQNSLVDCSFRCDTSWLTLLFDFIFISKYCTVYTL